MRINLLPEEYRPQPMVELRRVFRLTGLIIFLLAALVFYGWNHLTSQSLAERVDVLEGQIAVYDQSMAEIEGIEAFIEKVRRWEGEVKKIDESYPPNQKLLWSLAAALPQEIWLTEVVITPGQKLTVKGNSLNLRAMGRLLQNINGLAFFQSSYIKEVREVTRDEVTAYQFEVEIDAGRDRH